LTTFNRSSRSRVHVARWRSIDNGAETFTWPDGGQTPFAGAKGTIRSIVDRSEAITAEGRRAGRHETIFSGCDPQCASKGRRQPSGSTKALKATGPRPASAQWGLFLRNHDELDLGRLTNAQRAVVFKNFGPDKNMQLYDRGIRRRLAPMLAGDRRRLELAYSLMCTLPGTPVIRYGDEIGMGDNLDLPERNCARTPMQWSTEPHAGFTESDKPCSPVIDEGPYGYEHINVAKQRRDPNSMLNWTERIIRMRKEVPEIGWGDFSVIATRDPAILAIRYDWRSNSVLFVHNLDEKPREASFSVGLAGDEGKHLINLLSEDHSEADDRSKHTLMLRWFLDFARMIPPFGAGRTML
jgi:maltose alpha-D-glucosyltransferase / alpha-amylase